jgi:hypothetical protein
MPARKRSLVDPKSTFDPKSKPYHNLCPSREIGRHSSRGLEVPPFRSVPGPLLPSPTYGGHALARWLMASAGACLATVSGVQLDVLPGLCTVTLPPIDSSCDVGRGQGKPAARRTTHAAPIAMARSLINHSSVNQMEKHTGITAGQKADGS